MADPVELPPVDMGDVPPAGPEVVAGPKAGPWEKHADESGSKPWEKYSAQADPDPTVGNMLQRRAKSGPSSVMLDALYSRESDKYDYGNSPLGMQTDVASAANPKEIRLALEKHAGGDPKKVGQDKQGRWWVESEGKKQIVEPEMLAKVLSATPEAVLSGAGTALGAAAGTAVAPGLGTAAGGIVGGGVGGAIGRGVSDTIKAVRGNYDTPFDEEVKRLGWSGLENAAFSAIAPAAKGVKELSRSAYRSMIGAKRHEEAIQRAVRIWEDSKGAVIPPVESFAPESTRMVRAEQNRNIVSYGGISPETPARIEYMTDRFRRVLRNQGLPEAEIEDAITSVISGRSATSATKAGEGIVDKAHKRVTESQAAITSDLDAARQQVRMEEAQMRAMADKTGRLGHDLEIFLEHDRDVFYGHFDSAYNQVHKLGGEARVIDMTEASIAAERLAQTVEPGAVPSIVQNVANLRQQAEQLTKQADKLRAAGQTGDAEALDQKAYELLHRTIEEAHGLRTLLREGMRAQTKSGGPPGTGYHFLSTVEDAVNGAFTDLAKSGSGLPGEAAKELKRVDSAYREGIKFYKNQTVKKITRDAQDGNFAAPEVIARNILNPNEVEAAKSIWARMPPQLREQVAAADLRDKITRASEMDTVTGDWVVKGKDFLREWRRTNAVNGIAYPPQVRAQIERWSQELAALDGSIELSAVKNPSQITQALQDAAFKQQELEEFVRNNPIGALASGEPKAIDRAVRAITKPEDEAATERAMSAIGRGTPEWKNVTNWALINLLEGAIKKTPAGESIVTGESVLKGLNAYTKKQQDMIFPAGLAEDIRTLAGDIFALFPQGGDMALGLSAGTVTNTSVFNLRQMWKQMRFWTLGKIADSQAYLALVADLKREHPNWDGVKQVLGQMGRTIFNAEEKPPERQMEVPNPTLGKRSSLDEGRIMSDVDERPEAGQQYAMANKSTLPGEGGLTAEIDKQAGGGFGRGASVPGPSRRQQHTPMSDAEYHSKHTELQKLKGTVAQLGPMREKLTDLGATPEQMNSFATNPSAAMKFIKERSPDGNMGKVNPGWQDRNQEFIDRIRTMQDELTGRWQGSKQ